ncbi:hypothetical protein L8106_16929 [Lyngbya sp. PCC 8106]|nr:hypothetical protein L8106_16929 [Lyngbya sp. PCC 8106]
MVGSWGGGELGRDRRWEVVRSIWSVVRSLPRSEAKGQPFPADELAGLAVEELLMSEVI